MLSFFFDGVPDPRLLDEEGNLRPDGADTPKIVSSHSAFVERRCGECHGGSTDFGFRVDGFSSLDDTVCLDCHAEVTTEFSHMHGPVAGGACLGCHEAHDSIHPTLLVARSPQLCLDCHGFHLEQVEAIPEHQDLERDCLDCHGGHGGDDRYLLRAVPRSVSDPEAADLAAEEPAVEEAAEEEPEAEESGS